MNEHRRADVLRAFLRGERVAVFCKSWEEAKDVLRLVAADLPEPPGFRVSFSAGRLGIVPEGVRGLSAVRVYSMRSSGHRGWSCDRVFVPADISAEDLAAVTPMVAVSRVRAVVRY